MLKGQPREHLIQMLQFPVLCSSFGLVIHTVPAVKVPRHQDMRNFRLSTSRMRRKVPGIDIFKVCSFILVYFRVLFPAPEQDLLSLQLWFTAMQIEVG